MFEPPDVGSRFEGVEPIRSIGACRMVSRPSTIQSYPNCVAGWWRRRREGAGVRRRRPSHDM